MRPARPRGSTTRRRASRRPTSCGAGSASTRDVGQTRPRPSCGCVGDSASCLPPPYSASPSDRLRHSLPILPRRSSPRSSTATPRSRAAWSSGETPWHLHPSALAWWTRGHRCATVAIEKASNQRAELCARSAFGQRTHALAWRGPTSAASPTHARWLGAGPGEQKAEPSRRIQTLSILTSTL